MIIYNIQTNGPSSELVIEVLNDSIYIEPSAIGYVLGDLTLNARLPNLSSKFKAYFLGEHYYKPTFSGTGKIFLKPTIGTYHKFNIKENEKLIINTNAFVACRETIKIDVKRVSSLNKFLSGAPSIYTEVSGNGNLVLQLPGAVNETMLDKGKFVAYSSDVAAYSASLNVSRESASKQGGLPIAHKFVDVYRGSGTIYFTPHPNKDSLPLRK